MSDKLPTLTTRQGHPVCAGREETTVVALILH